MSSDYSEVMRGGVPTTPEAQSALDTMIAAQDAVTRAQRVGMSTVLPFLSHDYDSTRTSGPPRRDVAVEYGQLSKLFGPEDIRDEPPCKVGAILGEPESIVYERWAVYRGRVFSEYTWQPA